MQDNCNEKIEFNLPDSLIAELEVIIRKENTNREDFAKEAFQFYITQKKRLCSKESMKSGYKEMAQINLSLAELGMTVEVLSSSEKKEGEIAKGEY